MVSLIMESVGFREREKTMTEKSDPKSKAQQYLDARKMQNGAAVSKKSDSDDDSSGGGNGKQMQGSYKLEKLVNVLAKGRLKAQSFWRFLSKEGLDSHETKKTTLGKQKEQTSSITEKLEKTQEVKQNQERAQELQQERQSIEQEPFVTEEEQQVADASKAEAVWEKANPIDDSARQRFGFQETTPSSFDVKSVAEATRRSVMGNHLPGSIISGTTNPLGFIKQTGITDATAQHTQDKFGNRIAGTIHSKEPDHTGAAQSNHTGKSAEAFLYSKNGSQFLSSKSQTTSSTAETTTAPTSVPSKSIRSRG